MIKASVHGENPSSAICVYAATILQMVIEINIEREPLNVDDRRRNTSLMVKLIIRGKKTETITKTIYTEII